MKSIKEYKQIKAQLESDKWYEHIDKALVEVQDYQSETDNYHLDVLDEASIDHRTKCELENGGWERVVHFLYGAELSSPLGYTIDGYGNLQSITRNDVLLAIENIIEELEHFEEVSEGGEEGGEEGGDNE